MRISLHSEFNVESFTKVGPIAAEIIQYHSFASELIPIDQRLQIIVPLVTSTKRPSALLGMLARRCQVNVPHVSRGARRPLPERADVRRSERVPTLRFDTRPHAAVTLLRPQDTLRLRGSLLVDCSREERCLTPARPGKAKESSVFRVKPLEKGERSTSFRLKLRVL
jgi:hypothetical protein